MRLYIEGYSVSKGWAVSLMWSDEECRSLPLPSEDELHPVRFIKAKEKAFRLVQRWNRLYATH